MEVVGTVGAIVGIIDVATRCIFALAEIRRHFNGTNLTIELLAGQLLAVRYAFDQIHALINDDLSGDDPHYELILSLDAVIKGCTLLMGMLDDHISKLEYDSEDEIKLASRARVALDSKALEECSTRLDRQTSALNFVLTAFRCREATQQQLILNQPASRSAIEQIRDDSSSLVVLYDTHSFTSARTAATACSSKFSMKFSFDRDLLQHKAYEKSFRSLMKANRNNDAIPMVNERLSAGPLRDIVPITTGVEKEPDVPNVITLIGYGCHLEQFWWTLKPVAYPRFRLVDRIAARDSIQQAVIGGLIQGHERTDQLHIHLPCSDKSSQLRIHCGAGRLNDQVVEAVRQCASPGHGLFGSHWSSPLSYFLSHVDRVFRPDYCPTSYDLMVHLAHTIPQKQEILLREEVQHALRPFPGIKVVLEGATRQPDASHPTPTMNVIPTIAVCTIDTRFFTSPTQDDNRDVLLTNYVRELGDAIKSRPKKPRDIMLLFTNTVITKQILKPHRKDCCTDCNEVCKIAFQHSINATCNDIRRSMDFGVFAEDEKGLLSVQHLEGNEWEYPQLRTALMDMLVQQTLRKRGI